MRKKVYLSRQMIALVFTYSRRGTVCKLASHFPISWRKRIDQASMPFYACLLPIDIEPQQFCLKKGWVHS